MANTAEQMESMLPSADNEYLPTPEKDFTASDLYRGSLSAVSFVTQKELQTLAELFEKSSDLNFIKQCNSYNCFYYY